MQIVIDISDDFIKDCDGNLDCVISLVDYKIDDVYSEEMGYANFKYTELPKGHGKLVDVEDVKDNIRKWKGYLDEDMMGRINFAMEHHIPTIIEADKESD